MPKYIKKPIEVEAYQFTEDMVKAHLFDKAPLPPGVKLMRADYNDAERSLIAFSATVLTIQGQNVKVSPGEWIATEPDGIHHYPIADEVFRKSYDPV